MKSKKFNYTGFTMMVCKSLYNFSVVIYKKIVLVFHYGYKRIDCWLAWRQLKKDVRECAECKKYFYGE
jgi:hypothetical protein